MTEENAADVELSRGEQVRRDRDFSRREFESLHVDDLVEDVDDLEPNPADLPDAGAEADEIAPPKRERLTRVHLNDHLIPAIQDLGRLRGEIAARNRRSPCIATAGIRSRSFQIEQVAPIRHARRAIPRRYRRTHRNRARRVRPAAGRCSRNPGGANRPEIRPPPCHGSTSACASSMIGCRRKLFGPICSHVAVLATVIWSTSKSPATARLLENSNAAAKRQQLTSWPRRQRQREADINFGTKTFALFP